MKKRDTVELFRTRLLEVIDRTGLTRSAFAEKVGMDRSTLSQLFASDNDRLPRVETLAGIAQAEQVSIDWLVGLSQEGPLGANVLKQSVQVEPDAPSPADERLARWQAEAAGYKIRYVPTTLPDLLKTDRIVGYEYGKFATVDPDQSLEQSHAKLELQRRSESEIEVCNSVQAVEGFARGEGIWRDLEVGARKEQLARMIALADELYPAFRWFLYDSRNRFSVPLTVFGAKRAVVYVGQMYFVFNSLEPIRVLTKHFDDLIRAAIVQPPQVIALLQKLLHDLDDARLPSG
ncbi:MAG TPA: helix-turn-helix transcriptional regulator [Polyangiaceae bacterium]|nr:helix-turn-helix transcriptional regulator [Polyangiaceae bacterium]